MAALPKERERWQRLEVRDEREMGLCGPHGLRSWAGVWLLGNLG
jgi:hypothetical protein